MRNLMLSVFTLISFASGENVPFFRKNYTYVAETQSFYKINPHAANWTDAYRRCGQEGATLATPLDSVEAQNILKLIRAEYPEIKSVYTGLQNILSDEIFASPEGQTEVYQRWAPGEPKTGAGKHCVTLDQQGLMHVVACRTVLPYVCKKTLASLKWNDACQLPDPDYKYNEKTKKCYKFHLTPRTWTEAYSVCLAEESYLAVINSVTEASALANLTNDAPKDSVQGNYLRGAILLGFHNKFGDGYETIFGESLEDAGYDLWGPGEPNSAGGAELCGSMYYDLDKPTTTVYLNDIGCDKWSCFFICEHDLTQEAKIDPRLNSVI